MATIFDEGRDGFFFGYGGEFHAVDAPGFFGQFPGFGDGGKG